MQIVGLGVILSQQVFIVFSFLEFCRISAYFVPYAVFVFQANLSLIFLIKVILITNVYGKYLLYLALLQRTIVSYY